MITVVENPEHLQPWNLQEVNSAKYDVNATKYNDGQSVLEFLLVLPLLFGITMFMIKVNTVIQMAIVDQRYARQQLLYTAGNGADYPRRSIMVETYAQQGGNVMTVGVAQQAPSSIQDETELNTLASVYSILRRGARSPGSEEVKTQDVPRSDIRVRNTVTLCLPFITTGKNTPVLPTAGGTQVTGPYKLPDSPQGWTYCSTQESFAGG